MAKTYEELLAGATQIKNNELPESNTHSLVGGQLVDMVEKQKEDSERIDNVSKSHKGYFQTLEQLKAKYPTPKEGETAWVGEPYPGNVFDVVDGAWHDTGVLANEGGGNGDTEKKYKIKLCLPNKIYWEVGKTLYIFKNSIVSAFNYRDYNIQVLMSLDQVNGKDYNRFFSYTPSAEGNITLTFKLYDDSHYLIEEKSVQLISTSPKNPNEMTTVLFIGDSLTYYNRITDEFMRILTSSDLRSEVKDTLSIYYVEKPVGRKYSNIQLIGTQIQNYKGWTGETKHEGYSGWGWSDFIKSGSPFYIGGKLDFNKYLSNNGFSTPNVIYIGLAWNDQKYVTDNGDGTWNTDVVLSSARQFISELTTQIPNAKVRLWTEQVPGTRGGIGNHPYGASEWADEHQCKLIQQAIAEMYIQLSEEFENVDVVWTIGMVDSEYSLQESEQNINGRIVDKEVKGVDYVHPADSGFFQIADGIIADFMNCISGTSEPLPPEDGIYKSANLQSILDYSGSFKLFSSETLSESQSAILAMDVSGYVGRNIKITAAQSVITGAYYSFFLSKLPSVLTDLSELQGKTFAYADEAVLEDRSIIVKRFVISTENNVSNTVIYTIPEGTKYLFFANLYAYENNPTAEITDESGTEIPEGLDLYVSRPPQLILDYEGTLKLFNTPSALQTQATIVAMDISKYQGKSVKITAAQSVIVGAYYSFFLSELPSVLTDLSELQGKTFAYTDEAVLEDRSIIVKRFVISTENNVSNTETYNIPKGAKYLFFTNLKSVVNDPIVEITDEPGIDIPDIEENEPVTLALKNSAKGNVILNFNGVLRTLQSGSVAEAAVYGADVSSYVGRNIEITAAQNVIDGAYYSFFLSELPSTLSSINELSGKTFPTSDITPVESQDIITGQFTVSTSDLQANTVTKTIPSGTKYLLFVNFSNITTANAVVK